MDRLKVLYDHISPLISTESSEFTLSIRFNRPKALNALTYDMLASISNLISLNHQKTIIFSSTLPKSYCAGGDITALVENDMMVPEFYRAELTTFYKISFLSKTIAIMQGFSIGGGNGLAMMCKFRVGTESTKFSMPESSIGLVPDTGASYFLTHLPNKAIGMYLMVTGNVLSGNDCYWSNVITHYVLDSNINSLYQDLINTGDISSALNKYSVQPYPEQSDLLKNLPEIEEVFSGVNDVDTILQRLSSKNSKFAEETFKRICQLCPLSIKVAIRSFNLGVNKNYKECLEQDYGIEVQLCLRRSYNYTTAVTQKFIKKQKGDIPWYPSELSQVTQEMVETIISNPEGPRLSLPDNY
jgi:enoyl-CoA hydratase/carnithine racemase